MCLQCTSNVQSCTFDAQGSTSVREGSTRIAKSRTKLPCVTPPLCGEPCPAPEGAPRPSGSMDSDGHPLYALKKRGFPLTVIYSSLISYKSLSPDQLTLVRFFHFLIGFNFSKNKNFHLPKTFYNEV
jgi:hypothetical protein